MELKKPLSFENQVYKLIENGMKVDDFEKAKKILSEVNYYRFTGYALQFRKDPSISIYKSGTSFDDVYRVYVFDTKLRNMLKPYLECVELLFRTRIAYGFSMSKCQDPPHDAHYLESNFYKKKEYQKIIKSLRREEEYNKDLLLVKHHKEKYGDKMPLWVLVELMSFSNLSKLYKAMYNTEQEVIAKSVKTRRDILANHLHCLSILRNKCAHGARLYDIKFSPPAKLGTSMLRSNKDLINDTLLAYLIILIRRLPNYSDKKRLVEEFLNLVDQYNDCIELDRLGCINGYENILQHELI